MYEYIRIYMNIFTTLVLLAYTKTFVLLERARLGLSHLAYFLLYNLRGEIGINLVSSERYIL